MDRDRDRIQIRGQPAVERERRLDSVAAFDASALKSLYLAVRAVEMNSVSIANDDAVNRIVNVFVKHRAHTDVNEFSGVDKLDRTAFAIQQIDVHDLGVAVSMSISELRRRGLREFGSGGRLLSPQGQLTLGVCSLTIH